MIFYDMNELYFEKRHVFVADSQLHATSVDFHTEKNREAHHTCDYELNNLIVRRGQEFELSVTFDRPLDPKRDRLILQFITGSRPQQSKNSLIRVKETKQLSTSSWGMRIGSTSGATVSLRVMSPADAFVGEYSVYVETKTKKPHSEEEMSFRQKRPEKIYILFNAWVKDDAVYIENDAHRKEYVLNDHGRIWIGSIKKMISIPWNFGQFEAVALTVFARLMELSNLGTSARGNPTSMCRVISRMGKPNVDVPRHIPNGKKHWTIHYRHLPGETQRRCAASYPEWGNPTSMCRVISRMVRNIGLFTIDICQAYRNIPTSMYRVISQMVRNIGLFTIDICQGKPNVDVPRHIPNGKKHWDYSLSTSARGNPTSMCRVISRMSNYNDRDGGVLYGRWSQEYPQNCTKPTEWVGSVAILKKFDQLHQVVRYGQCWVFSGLVTTLLRAIGIPTRSVTNFQSAHDSDHSMTIDYHFDFEGKPMDELNDSVWNFHVWNESYFARPDLPPGYGGWQAHDPTPQETSDGVFRCGPCPVKAVKSGEVYLPYDTGFVFAEVNGDKVYWSVDITGEMSVTYIDKKSVGKFISTKAVGSNERDDITKNYKFDEGSAEERKAVELAYKYSSRKDRHIYSKPSSNDVSFEIRTGEHTMITMIGEDFQCELFIKNSSRDKRTIQVAIVSKVAFYTGINAKDLKDLHKEVTMRGGESK
ncbi:hypothetical protein QZH41_019598 [Actinostola sp. cb2023]|nr:hypothetical protein QZH41_019598 [Actinostola sp. cb2023]